LMPLFEATVVSALSQRTGSMNVGAYGKIRLWGSIGYIATVALAGFAFDYIAITWLVPMTVFALALVAANTWFVHDQPNRHASKATEPIMAVLLQPKVMAFMGSCFFNALSQGAMLVFYGIYFVEQGYSKTMVGLLTSFAVVAEVLVLIGLKQVFAKYRYYSIWLLGFALTAVRFVLVAEAPQFIVIQFFAQALHIFTWGTYHATAIAVVQRQFPGRLATRGQAIYTSVSYALGGAVGAYAAGALWQQFGAKTTFYASAGAALCGLVLALIWPVAIKELNKES
jgi:MFS transporter, PPP family, 3-phenylpropionic acid transporter